MHDATSLSVVLFLLGISLGSCGPVAVNRGSQKEAATKTKDVADNTGSAKQNEGAAKAGDTSGNDADGSAAVARFKVSGTVKGLTGTLVLQNNSGNNLSISSPGAFSFSDSVEAGKSFSVSILTQPANKTCAVYSGSGSQLAADVTNVLVNCSEFYSLPQNAASFNGLGSHDVNAVYVSAGKLYVATERGLSISTDGGKTYTTRTTANGLGSNVVNGIFVAGSDVYAATTGGLAVSTDGGQSFVNKMSLSGRDDNLVFKVQVSDGTIYASTPRGLSISSDGGNTWVTKSDVQFAYSVEPLGNDVFVSGGKIYVSAGASGQLLISQDGGKSWLDRTPADRLFGTRYYGLKSIFVSDGTIYAATLSGLFTSTDDGNTWTRKSDKEVSHVSVFGDVIYAFYRNFSSYISTNRGKTWRDGPQASQAFFLDNGTTYAFVSGEVRSSPDNGTTWVTMNQDLSGFGRMSVNSVSVFGGVLFAGTPSGSGLFVSRDNGGTWVDEFSKYGKTFPFMKSLAVLGNSAWAGTNSGLFVSTDGGNSWINKTRANGLGDNVVNSVFVDGSKIYAGTKGGLSISTDGGQSFVNKTIGNGLAWNDVESVSVSGNIVCAATSSGLAISANGGQSFANKTTADGLGWNEVRGVYVSGNIVYAATSKGLAISTNSGQSFVNKTTANGLGGNDVRSVSVSGTTIYAATNAGLSISVDGGTTWTNKTTADGLADDQVNGVYVSGGTLYVATARGLSVMNPSVPVR